VPLLPEISLEVDDKLIERQLELIDLVEDEARRAELRFYTAAFLQPYFKQKVLSTRFLEDIKMYEHWLQVPVFGEQIQRIIQEEGKKVEQKVRVEARAEGRLEGRREGLALALQENIMDVLSLRFGLANGRIARTIHAIDEPKKLRVIFRRVVKADSLTAVKKMLAAENLSAKKKTRPKSRP